MHSGVNEMGRQFKETRVNVDFTGDLAIFIRLYCRLNKIEYRNYIRDLVEKDMLKKMKETNQSGVKSVSKIGE